MFTDEYQRIKVMDKEIKDLNVPFYGSAHKLLKEFWLDLTHIKYIKLSNKKHQTEQT